MVLTFEAGSLGNSLSFWGRKKYSPLGVFFAQQIRGNTWENRAAMVGIIRIMIETLWIRRYISVWKRIKSLWTLTWVQCFFPPTAYLTVRRPGSKSSLFCLVLWPNDLSREEGGASEFSCCYVEFVISLFQSTPENQRSSSAMEKPRTGWQDMWILVLVVTGRSSPHRISVSLAGLGGRWVRLKGHEPSAQGTNLALTNVCLAYMVPKIL